MIEINFKEMMQIIEGTPMSKIYRAGVDVSALRQTFSSQGNLSFAFKDLHRLDQVHPHYGE